MSIMLRSIEYTRSRGARRDIRPAPAALQARPGRKTIDAGARARRREIEALGPWFHNLHLPDGTQTALDHFLGGDFPAFKWREIAPVIPEKLKGWRVLDIGCTRVSTASSLRNAVLRCSASMSSRCILRRRGGRPGSSG
jgi:hypothetical protein